MVPLQRQLRSEGATLTAWPALRQAQDGLLAVALAQGYTKRANSVHCLDPSDGGYAELAADAAGRTVQAPASAPVFQVDPLTRAGDRIERARWPGCRRSSSRTAGHGDGNAG